MYAASAYSTNANAASALYGPAVRGACAERDKITLAATITSSAGT